MKRQVEINDIAKILEIQDFKLKEYLIQSGIQPSNSGCIPKDKKSLNCILKGLTDGFVINIESIDSVKTEILKYDKKLKVYSKMEGLSQELLVLVNSLNTIKLEKQSKAQKKAEISKITNKINKIELDLISLGFELTPEKEKSKKYFGTIAHKIGKEKSAIMRSKRCFLERKSLFYNSNKISKKSLKIKSIEKLFLQESKNRMNDFDAMFLKIRREFINTPHTIAEVAGKVFALRDFLTELKKIGFSNVNYNTVVEKEHLLPFTERIYFNRYAGVEKTGNKQYHARKTLPNYFKVIYNSPGSKR